MSAVGHRKGYSIVNAIFAGSILLPLLFPFSSIPEFAPPQVIYSKDLIPLLFAPWVAPSSMYCVLSRLIQAALLFRLQQDSIFACYFTWIAIALLRTLIGFLLSRSVGWAYPRLFSHWALYESCGGCGPSLVTYLIASGARPDFSALLSRLGKYKWEVTESLVLLVVCALVSILDHAPWTYSLAVGLAVVTVAFRTASSALFPPDTIYPPRQDSLRGSPLEYLRVDVRLALLLFAFIPLPSLISALLTRPPVPQIPPPFQDGTPFLEIVLLSYPRPNDPPLSSDRPSILSTTIASYLHYVSPSTALSVFTHARPSTHPSFSRAQEQFQDSPVTFYADPDTHPDARDGQYLHLAEAFRWLVEKGPRGAEWVMLVEDDFPICGEWGWNGVLRVMHTLQQGQVRGQGSSLKTAEMWGGFVGTGGSGLILHRMLLPILANTLRLHAHTASPFPPFMARRPPDIIVQDCLLGIDPLCPSAPSAEERADGVWFARSRPTMVVTSRLVMDHIGGSASTAKGRVYDSDKWRCGWRHPFHGRPEVAVVPV